MLVVQLYSLDEPPERAANGRTTLQFFFFFGILLKGSHKSFSPLCEPLLLNNFFAFILGKITDKT